MYTGNINYGFILSLNCLRPGKLTAGMFPPLRKKKSYNKETVDGAISWCQWVNMVIKYSCNIWGR